MTKYANKQHFIIEYVILSFLPNASLESIKSQIPILIPILIPSERCKSNVIVFIVSMCICRLIYTMVLTIRRQRPFT